MQSFPRAIIFDMDGLLVDSEPVWAEAENDVCVLYDITIEHHVRQKLIGLRSDEFVGGLITAYNMQVTVPVLHASLMERMLTIIPLKVKPKPGAQELIEFVAHQQVPRAIASSSPIAVIEAIVGSQGWDEQIPLRFSADIVARGKPAPDVYLKAAEMLGVLPQDCLALEDSPTGARAAVAAGMTCYAVPDLGHTRMEAFDGITDHRFDSLHTVLGKLKQL